MVVAFAQIRQDDCGRSSVSHLGSSRRRRRFRAAGEAHENAGMHASHIVTLDVKQKGL